MSATWPVPAERACVLWVEVFAVFGVCHLAGDFILQTEWQATRKFGGLGSDGSARRALLAHTATYTHIVVLFGLALLAVA